MTKKKKRLLVVVVLAVVLVALLARPVVNLVIEWLDPGQAPLNDLFKLKKNEVALVINDEQNNERLGSQWESYCKQSTAKWRQLFREPAGNTEICDEIHGNHILPCVGGDGG